MIVEGAEAKGKIEKEESSLTDAKNVKALSAPLGAVLQRKDNFSSKNHPVNRNKNSEDFRIGGYAPGPIFDLHLIMLFLGPFFGGGFGWFLFFHSLAWVLVIPFIFKNNKARKPIQQNSAYEKQDFSITAHDTDSFTNPGNPWFRM